MTADVLHSFFLSALTVGKVCLGSVLGLLVSRGFQDMDKSLNAFCHIALNIFLPCLVLTQISSGINWVVMEKCFWAFILPLVPMVLGLAAARAFKSYVPSDFHGLLYISCTFQDVLSFGLGILMNFGISWFTKTESDEAQAYVFLYHMIHSLLFWVVGTTLIEKLVVKEEENSAVITTATDSDLIEENNYTEVKGGSGDDEECKESKQRSNPVKSPEEYQPHDLSTLPKTQTKRLGSMTWYEYIKVQLGYVLKRDFIAGIIGLLITLFPPMVFLFSNYLGEVILGGVSLLAGGAPPLLLFVVGFNLIAAREYTVALPMNFVVFVAVVRFLIIPLIGFGIIHALLVSNLMVFQRPFVLTMLLLMCAPTGMNTSILCSMYSYKVKEQAKLLLFTYLTCIFTTTAWLTVYICYLESG